MKKISLKEFIGRVLRKRDGRIGVFPNFNYKHVENTNSLIKALIENLGTNFGKFSIKEQMVSGGGNAYEGGWISFVLVITLEDPSQVKHLHRYLKNILVDRK